MFTNIRVRVLGEKGGGGGGIDEGDKLSILRSRVGEWGVSRLSLWRGGYGRRFSGTLWVVGGSCGNVREIVGGFWDTWGGGGFEGVLANSTFYTKEREGADYCYLAFQYFCFETFPPPSISTWICQLYSSCVILVFIPSWTNLANESLTVSS